MITTVICYSNLFVRSSSTHHSRSNQRVFYTCLYHNCTSSYMTTPGPSHTGFAAPFNYICTSESDSLADVVHVTLHLTSLSAHPPIYLPAHSAVCLFVCLSLRPLAYPLVYPPARLLPHPLARSLACTHNPCQLAIPLPCPNVSPLSIFDTALRRHEWAEDVHVHDKGGVRVQGGHTYESRQSFGHAY